MHVEAVSSEADLEKKRAPAKGFPLKKKEDPPIGGPSCVTWCLATVSRHLLALALRSCCRFVAGSFSGHLLIRNIPASHRGLLFLLHCATDLNTLRLWQRRLGNVD